MISDPWRDTRSSATEAYRAYVEYATSPQATKSGAKGARPLEKVRAKDILLGPNFKN